MLDLIGHLEKYTTISLKEMASVKLMNRTDTKFICPYEKIGQLLDKAAGNYLLQEDSGERILPYGTTYFDTDGLRMYHEHHRGKRDRYKVRIREYILPGTRYLEVKHKDNKGKTRKKRILFTGEGDPENETFVSSRSPYRLQELSPSLRNRFERLTLVNKGMTERLTIDFHLETENLRTGKKAVFPDLAVIELKRDGRRASEMPGILRGLRIKPAKFSKYCIGLALTDPDLKQNRFKERIRKVGKCTEIILK